MLKNNTNTTLANLLDKCLVTIFASLLVLLPAQIFGQTNRVDKEKETFNLKQLSTLLAEDNQIKAVETILPERANQSQVLTVRLQPRSVSSSNLLMSQQLAETSLAVSDLQQSNSAITRNRVFEFSPDQILILAVDQNKQILWWDAQIDPRLVRSESADEAGNLQGHEYFRTDAEMLVALPQDKRIVELRFYVNNPDSASPSLKLLESLPFNNENSNNGEPRLP